ncbi:uncharacterized protein LOC143915201 [Arctopsyche grandis]|uniref:uncharacterized protein LOC143915201 n=1 Tax=Arctopsyche grandis TaxID=121162 RepID=UPI00406D76BF
MFIGSGTASVGDERGVVGCEVRREEIASRRALTALGAKTPPFTASLWGCHNTPPLALAIPLSWYPSVTDEIMSYSYRSKIILQLLPTSLVSFLLVSHNTHQYNISKLKYTSVQHKYIEYTSVQHK